MLLAIAIWFDIFAINGHIFRIFNDNSLHNIKIALKLFVAHSVFWRLPIRSLVIIWCYEVLKPQ